MPSTQLNFGRDVQGFNAFAPQPSQDKFSATLTAGGNSTVTVPSNFKNWNVTFSIIPGSDIWVAYNSSGGSITATAPAGSTFASTNSELNPGSRTVTAGTTINILNNGSASVDIGVVFYAIS